MSTPSPANSARRSLRMSSSVLPENMDPVITSILPRMGGAKLDCEAGI